MARDVSALEIDRASQARLDALPEIHREFVSSGAVLDFIPEKQLQHELSTRDAAGLRALLTDLMALAERMSYDPEQDMGAAPLNLASKRFNAIEPTAAPLREAKREPGPFSVHRYLYPQSGVPTFGNGLVAIWPEDLVAGAVDVAIIGVPSNMSSGRRDARWTPDILRAANTLGALDSQTLLDPLEVLSVVDYGDFSVDNMASERSVEHLTQRVAETAATGAVPILIGGDTSILYPAVRGVARQRGKGEFGLLHLSAHPDAERDADHTISDTQALFLILEEGLVDGENAIPVGLRGPAVDAATLQWLRDEQVLYHTMAEIHERGFDKVLRRISREVERGPDAFFVSLDVSVIDPSQMIAAGRVVTQGMQLHQVAGLVRNVCASREVAGFAITDMASMLDLSRLSALNTGALVNACLGGMAVRVSGMKPDEFNPLVLDHGR